jgi:predicted ATP-grasp superfamily ATP-dependent carboligase
MSRDRTNTASQNSQPGAIILGANFVGLAVARSLGAKGIRVWALDADRSRSIAQFSRYTERFLEVRTQIAEILLFEAQHHDLQGWVLIPVTDEYVELLSTERERLGKVFRVSSPPLEVTRFALDKRLTYKLAHQLGVDAPWTATCSRLEDLDLEQLPYPVILKPAVNHHFFPHTNLKALAVENVHELRQRFEQMCHYIPAEEILIQERIPGNGENQFSFCAMASQGQVCGSLVAQRRRQYPVEFGNASTFVKTIDQPVVQEGGKRFLETLEFDGVAEIEFKFDPRDGKYKILDVNPRIWGWHALGKSVGIDFAYLLWCQQAGKPLESTQASRHAAWMREITDVFAIAKSRNRGAECKELLNAFFAGRLTFASFKLLDPLPFFAEFAMWLKSGASRQQRAKEFLQPAVANTAEKKPEALMASLAARQP